MCRFVWVLGVGLALSGLAVGCGSSDETEADRVGVAAECSDASECESPDEDIALECLGQFKGGYCGLADCGGDADCPDGSACIAYDDGVVSGNFCFRLCQDKPECNLNRSVENESNCSSNVEFVDGRQERKACVPPSSGL
jgi:hypothetical protein